LACQKHRDCAERYAHQTLVPHGFLLQVWADASA
jgi:hypothetical protein